MSIRTRIFGPRADDPLLPVKNPKGAQPDTLNSIAIARTELRRGNARSGDRHRLKAETATLRHDGTDHQVELVNVSGGGAMVRTGLELHLWDHVGLVLGGESELDCAVRWIKGSDIGIEFAHETQIDCDKDARNELLRAVIRKSFPDIAEISFEYPKRRADDYPNIDFGQRPAPAGRPASAGLERCHLLCRPPRLRGRTRPTPEHLHRGCAGPIRQPAA